MEDIEIWMPVVGYENLYEVSNYGKVKNAVIGNTLKHHVRSKYKYHTVCLSKKGEVKNKYIHSLVLEAFDKVRPDGMECLHFNGDHEDNYIGNLRWDTHKENVQDALRHGTFNLMVGANHVMAKITEIDALEIKRLLLLGYKQKDIGKMFGVSQKHVSKIKLGLRWKRI